jgi:peptidoglycan/xylan/chitin deacetylase (PgdA/CDA1 family)
MALRSKTFQKDEIQRTNDIIGEILNLRPLAFRPPYGYFDFDTLALSEEEKLRFVMWTVDARDFSESSADSILRNVTSRTAPGTVFLFHDNERTSAKLAGYLNPLLDRLLEHGLQFSQLPL